MSELTARLKELTAEGEREFRLQRLWFFLHPSIQQVDLVNNNLTGVEIPKRNGGGELVALDLGFNRIEGFVPIHLGSTILTNLQQYIATDISFCRCDPASMISTCTGILPSSTNAVQASDTDTGTLSAYADLSTMFETKSVIDSTSSFLIPDCMAPNLILFD
ncbi:hypothetical protein ACFX13_003316 [Malus domestica]